MLLLVTAACVLAQPAFIPPNITVLFLSDDHNAADYGMAGNPAVHTPAVDRLAREGVRFVNAYTPMAMCAPSRSALYTARYPMRSGAFANHYPVYKGVPSVTGRLQEEGWAVHLVGKSHVNEATSTSFEGYPTNKATATTFNFTSRNGTQSYYPNAATTSQLVEQIEPLLFRHKFSGVPMCLVVASYLPHGPYPSAPINYTRILLMVRAIPRDKKVCAPAIVAKQSAPPGAHTDPTRTPAPCPRAPTIHLPFVTGSYYQNIMDENAQLEAVLGIFEARGLLDSTLFVYASDHGTEGKWTAYEAGLKVPLVVRWPAGGVQGGENSTALVSLLDIFPTFLEIAGAAQPAFDGLDGRSLLPLLTAPKLSHHKHVFSVATRQNIQQPSVFPSRSVRGARYKLIVNFNAKERNLGDAAGDTNVHSRHGRSYPREFIRLVAPIHSKT